MRTFTAERSTKTKYDNYQIKLTTQVTQKIKIGDLEDTISRQETYYLFYNKEIIAGTKVELPMEAFNIKIQEFTPMNENGTPQTEADPTTGEIVPTVIKLKMLSLK